MFTIADILAEAASDYTLYIGCALIVTAVLVRAFAPADRDRLRALVVLFVLHLVLVPLAALFRPYEGSAYNYVRLPCLIFAATASVRMSAAILFSVVLPRLGLVTPRVFQDVVATVGGVISIFVLSSRAGINLSGLVATSAVVTAVIGFALQDILGNIIGGLALHRDHSVNVGDWITVGDVSGRIKEIRWRYTAVETRTWETVVIPNNLLMKGQVTVQGRRAGEEQKWRRSVPFHVDYRQSPTAVIDAVTEALLGSPIEHVASDPAPDCIIADLGENVARYQVRYWLTNFSGTDKVDSAIRSRIYFSLKRADIPISVPSSAIHLSESSSERRAEKVKAAEAERLAAIGRIDLFRTLKEADRAQLAAQLKHSPFTRGETLTRQGAPADWLYVVVSGELSVSVNGEGDLLHEVARLGPGSFFGEMSLLTGEPRTATVLAQSDVDCYRLDSGSFAEILRAHPELADEVAQVLAERRIGLFAARENLDQQAKERRMLEARSFLLGRIRQFFGLK